MEEETPLAVVPSVNVFNYLADDWTVKDEWKVTWHEGMLLAVSVLSKIDWFFIT